MDGTVDIQTHDPDVSGLGRVRPEVSALAGDLVRLRRDFHRHPERGFEEVRTAGRVVEELRGMGGWRVRANVAKTGVIADLETGSADGPSIALRADMDALRAQEENAHLDFRSANAGVMHACGHDGHMAILLGVARLLARRRERIGGGVRLLFQPAEEGPGGAEPMIAAGALEDPRPEAVFGLHLWSRLPTGYAAVAPGPVMAFTDEVYFRIHGKGGHGASPHEGIDAILASAHLILALQSIVSRNVDPLQSVVITIGKIQGGTVMNAIAEDVLLDGTQRAFTPQVRDLCTRRVREVAAGIDAALGTRTHVEYVSRYPALVNDAGMARVVHEQAAAVLGAGRIVTDFRIMGGEDMSFYLGAVPGCFFFLGAGNREKKADSPHHSPHFDFDEDAMTLGVEIFVRIAERFFGRLS